MQSVILFGATGNLGKQVAGALVARGHRVTCVVRNAVRAQLLQHLPVKIREADCLVNREMENITEGFDVVVSCLGKSVSPNDRSKHSFIQVDLDGNTLILKDALRNNVKKFVYVSAFHSERYVHLEYFRVHHVFSERLKQSGLDYSIVKPPAIFSAFLDAIAMAKKGWLANLGDGQCRTNPIHEADLAHVVVDAIAQPNAVLEVGGKEILTRKQLNELVQHYANPEKKLRTVPIGVVKTLLPLLKLADRHQYDKFAFFVEVMQHDVVAPQIGERKFEDYLRSTVGRSV